MGILDQIKKNVDSLQDEVDSENKALREAEAQRLKLINAPVPKDDLKLVVRQVVDNASRGFNEGLRAALLPFLHEGAALQQPARVDTLGVAGLGRRRDETTSLRQVDQLLCGLFGAQVTDALIKAVDAMDWPNDGLPYAQRAAALAKVDGDIFKIRARIRALYEQAESVGVSLK